MILNFICFSFFKVDKRMSNALFGSQSDIQDINEIKDFLLLPNLIITTTNEKSTI